MKKTIIFISTLLLLSLTVCSFARPLKTVKSPQIRTRHYNKKFSRPKREIALQYSTLTIKNKAARHLNTLIHKMLQQRINHFIKNSKDAVRNFTSSLNINDSVFFYQPKRLISMQYRQITYFAGQAHPNTNFSVINYDLASDKLLHFQDILIHPKKDLQYISTYCIQQLLRKNLGPTQFIKQGAGAEFKNYPVWNFTHQGLLITFYTYQVAAYVFGPQRVLIPYPLLKGRIKMRYYQLL